MEKRIQRLQGELESLRNRIADSTAKAQSIEEELDLIHRVQSMKVGDVVQFKRRGRSGEFTGTVVGWYTNGARVLLGPPEDRELVNVPYNWITEVRP